MKTLKTAFVFALLCLNSSVIFSQSWTQLSTTGTISARTNASAIYVSQQNKMYVFGGITAGGNVNELWELDLNSNRWSLVPTTSALLPAPRATHICMYDSLQNRMLVWSGQGSVLYNDIWAFNFDDNTWTELFADGNVFGAPLKRYGTATVFDPINRNVVNFAGFTTSGRFEDTWRFNVGNSKWTNESNTTFPAKRCLTSQSFAADRREMIVFGGQGNGNLNDIWSLNLHTYQWANLTPAQSPAARHFSSNVYCGDGKVVVFGGSSLNQGNTAGGLNDLWLFNLDTQLWDTLPQPSAKPSARYGHTAVYIPAQDKMIVFGGQGIASLSNETWVYSGISPVATNTIEVSSRQPVFTSYPNPATDKVTFKLSSVTNEESATIVINDMNGKVIEQLDVRLRKGENEINFQTGSLPSGIYTCLLKTNSYSKAVRMTIF